MSLPGTPEIWRNCKLRPIKKTVSEGILHWELHYSELSLPLLQVTNPTLFLSWQHMLLALHFESKSHSQWKDSVLGQHQIRESLSWTKHCSLSERHPCYTKAEEGVTVAHKAACASTAVPERQGWALGWAYLAALRYISKSQSLTPGIHTSSSCCVTVSPSGEGKGCRSGSLA